MANDGEFLTPVRSSSGRQVRVISGEDEARLILLGVTQGLPDLKGHFLRGSPGGHAV